MRAISKMQYVFSHWDYWFETNVLLQSTPTKHRPEGFPQWSKNGRDRASGKKVPGTVDLDNIRAKWWRWWDDANPASRSRREGKILPGDCDCWEDLHLPGKEGFVSFIVMLRWWFDKARGCDEGWHWTEALKSVYETMCFLLDDLRYVLWLFSALHYLIRAGNRLHHLTAHWEHPKRHLPKQRQPKPHESLH
jgi:hypothetical protein